MSKVATLILRMRLLKAVNDTQDYLTLFLRSNGVDPDNINRLYLNEFGDTVSYNSIMCGGVEYQDHKIYFPQPNARLPVMLRHGGVTWVTWGRRKKGDSGKFPNGGWARIDSIKSGKWKPWHPRPVLIPAENFMEKDHDGQSHWITLTSGMAIQALLAERKGEHRVYVVTVDTPPESQWIHDRWPRLVRLRA